jgi:hypothetical protein
METTVRRKTGLTRAQIITVALDGAKLPRWAFLEVHD